MTKNELLAQAEALKLAELFHKTYERLAPNFGYETKAETRSFDPTTPNGRLMIAVCAELRAQAAATPEPVAPEPVAYMIWSPFSGPAQFTKDKSAPVKTAQRADYTCTPLYAHPPEHPTADAYNREADSKQAQIDRLMLEYCPDEITPEQIAEWQRKQVVAGKVSDLHTTAESHNREAGGASVAPDGVRSSAVGVPDVAELVGHIHLFPNTYRREDGLRALTAQQEQIAELKAENTQLGKLLGRGRASNATELGLSAQLETQRNGNIKLLERIAALEAELALIKNVETLDVLEIQRKKIEALKAWQVQAWELLDLTSRQSVCGILLTGDEIDLIDALLKETP